MTVRLGKADHDVDARHKQVNTNVIFSLMAKGKHWMATKNTKNSQEFIFSFGGGLDLTETRDWLSDEEVAKKSENTNSEQQQDEAKEKGLKYFCSESAAEAAAAAAPTHDKSWWTNDCLQ